MIKRIILAIIITLIVFLKNNTETKVKALFHPIFLTPFFGLFFGDKGFITGITVGVIVELLWGEELLKPKEGMRYSLLVSLLTLTMVLLTENISLFFNLTIIVILVFSFQESLGFLEDRNIFIVFLFCFNLLILFSVPLMKELLGLIPAQFLNNLAISGGSLLPIVGLSIFLVNALQGNDKDNIIYLSYATATVSTATIVFNGYSWAIIIFPIIWYILYSGIQKFSFSSSKIAWRIILILVIIITTPLIVEWNSPFLTGGLQYFLWIEATLSLFSILFLFKLTALEGYFIISLIGIIIANLGILL